MPRVFLEIVLFPIIGSTAVLFGCYESTTLEGSSADRPAADTDTLLDTGESPYVDTEEVPSDTQTDTALPPQESMTFRIRNRGSVIAYFDLSFRKWMDLNREKSKSENEIYLDWPYCVERCVDVPNDNDPLCHRPCIVNSQVYVLYPGDEVDVAWDGNIRLLDPDRLPYCACSIETEPLPGSYTVTLLAYNDIRCPDLCPLPTQSGMVQGAVVSEVGLSLISITTFEVPMRDPLLVIEFGTPGGKLLGAPGNLP